MFPVHYVPLASVESHGKSPPTFQVPTSAFAKPPGTTAPAETPQVEPVMKRVIGPYVFQGGGAKSLNYQSLARDLARATLEIPFNIPSYFALVARALGILEGSWEIDGGRA